MDNNLPKQFESFTEARRNGFLAAKNIKDNGKRYYLEIYVH